MFLRKKFSAVMAGIIAAAAMLQSAAVISADTGSFDMNISVNLAGEKKEISPYIYGVNQYGNNCKNVKVKNVRQGGNRYTGYNWETNWSNAGEDWVNSSDTNIGDDKDGPGYAAVKLSSDCEKYGIPYKITTLQMAGYVSADKLGTVETPAPSDRWNEVIFRKGSELSLTPDLTDNKVYMDEYVNYIVKTLGDSTTATGIQGYSLDNEPFLWNDTHPLIHPEEAGCNELIEKSIELAKVVKEIDPNAEVYGPALWGMLPCITAGSNGSNNDAEWDKIKDNYGWYVDYYLECMAKAEKETGTRLLDVFDVHYYAQDCSTDDAKLQAARSLYDETYKENSWLQPAFGKYFPFLPKLRESIDKYYPGTKLAVSEYNLADIANEKITGKTSIAAIAETETLGAFAANDVYFATYWGTLPDCPYVESAINLYTNYDGEGNAFGDTLVEAKTDDISKATAFASVNGNDDSDVMVVLSNKDKSDSENAVITLDGASSDYKSAVVYAVTQDSSEIRIIDVQNDVKGNKVEVKLPPLSVAQIVISDEETDKTLYEEPDIDIKETVYNFDELEESKGAKLIPLGDKEHLKEIRIGISSYSTEGSAYYSGGGGLCFSNLIPADGGKAVWGFKGCNYSKGETEIIIPFDNEFSVGESETIQATVGDDTAELQTNWWAYSEKQGDKGSDVVIEYKTVTLVYEYDNNSQPTEPTEPSETIAGDVNSDGKISTADVTMLTKYLVNEGTLKNNNAADVNSDGRVDVFDLVALKRIVLKNKK